jgi:multidrug resistance efflux pump
MGMQTVSRVAGRILGMVIVAGAAVLSVWVWKISYESPRTDDAAVRANTVGIAPHVSGPIVELAVSDNQFVREKELLFVVDPRVYEVRLAAARADLALVNAELEAQRDAISAAAAALVAREAEEKYAGDYLRRVEPLLKDGFVTMDHVEAARKQLRTARADRERAMLERERAEKLLAQYGDLYARRQAAEATVRGAELNVDYCRVVAPFDGYATNLNIAVGEYAREGTQVLTLVDNRQWYVMANFQETYMGSIRPGMKAEVYLMGYPGKRFHGEVQGIGWAIHQPDGATVQGLPAIQPTLNWVRFAQRFPVRIRMDPPDPHLPYRMGNTAVVTILGTREGFP